MSRVDRPVAILMKVREGRRRRYVQIRSHKRSPVRIDAIHHAVGASWQRLPQLEACLKVRIQRRCKLDHIEINHVHDRVCNIDGMIVSIVVLKRKGLGYDFESATKKTGNENWRTLNEKATDFSPI